MVELARGEGGPLSLDEVFWGLAERCAEREHSVSDVVVWNYFALRVYYPDIEGFCLEAYDYVVRESGISPAACLLCASSSGRGATSRIREHYGLWRSVRPAYSRAGIEDMRECRVSCSEDFFFVGTAEVDYAKLPAVLAGVIDAHRQAEDFVYISGSEEVDDRIRCAIEEALSGSGTPSWARFDLFPLFDAMKPDDAILCVQNYGDGLSVYLFRKGRR